MAAKGTPRSRRQRPCPPPRPESAELDPLDDLLRHLCCSADGAVRRWAELLLASAESASGPVSAQVKEGRS